MKSSREPASIQEPEHACLDNSANCATSSRDADSLPDCDTTEELAADSSDSMRTSVLPAALDPAAVAVLVGRKLPSALQESAAAISRFTFEQSGSRRLSVARRSTSAAALGQSALSSSGSRSPAT